MHHTMPHACRDLAFQGNTGKSTVVLMPTVHCLVQLVEAPYTVVPLADVEIVNLERVGFNGKTFDLVIIFKDFAHDVLMIGSIPTQVLDDIKSWLNTQDIKFFESKLNLQWKQILKTIVADPDEFMQAVRPPPTHARRPHSPSQQTSFVVVVAAVADNLSSFPQVLTEPVTFGAASNVRRSTQAPELRGAKQA